MVVIATGVSVDMDDICKQPHDIKYVVDPDDCSLYYECDGDKFVEAKACIDDLLFNGTENDECQPPDMVPSCKKVIKAVH